MRGRIFYGERRAATKLIDLTRREKFRESYIYVNNRLEGNAIATIRAVIASLDRQ